MLDLFNVQVAAIIVNLMAVQIGIKINLVLVDAMIADLVSLKLIERVYGEGRETVFPLHESVCQSVQYAILTFVRHRSLEMILRS